jgi:hypothetical protein
MQIVGGLCIIVWTVTMSGATFLCIKYTVGMQVSEEVEDLGLDVSEHGLKEPFVMPPPPMPLITLPPPPVMLPPMPAAADDNELGSA